MWVTPIDFTIAGEIIRFDTGVEPLPLPPWSGVPVAMEMEVTRALLAQILKTSGEGALQAYDETGAVVACQAVVDPQGSHTCETDTVLMLVQCGPFQPVLNKEAK